jgi:hypothetical protein
LQQINRFIVKIGSWYSVGACRSQSKRSITMERKESSHRARRLEHGCASAVAYHENEEPLALDKIGIQK